MHDIVSKPFSVDFIQNNIKFVLKGTNISDSGAKSRHTLTFVSQPPVGASFILKINDREFTYNIISENQWDGSIYQIINKNGKIDEDLIKKLKANYYIMLNFDLEMQSLTGQVRIHFFGKKIGKNIFTVTNIHTTYSVFIDSSVSGRERAYFKDYKFLVRFNVEYADKGNIIDEMLPEILLDADINGSAELPCTILSKLTKNIDYPRSFMSPYNAYILSHILVKYSLLHCEMYEGSIQNVKESTIFFGINGKSSTSSATINIPDWEDISFLKLESGKYIRLYGCDNNKTFFSHLDGKDFLYLCLFEKLYDNEYVGTLMGNLSILYRSGKTSVINLKELEINNFSIVRIPVHLNALNIPDKSNVIEYTISVWDSNNPTGVMCRKFIINSENYFIHEFLLQNKYGVLEYFYCETKKTESVVNANDVVLNNINDIDITDKNKIFTIKTGVKQYEQLKLLSQASYTSYNFIIIKNTLVPIYIMPESIEIIDEKKDLQETTFKFRFKDEDTEEIVVMNRINPGFERENPVSENWRDKLGNENALWNDSDKFNESKILNIWK